ncbi:unnamed protein product [Symbiodinium microadriaticum]|nr:unnamed protein product [Symbiodinium microadriaticum]
MSLPLCRESCENFYKSCKYQLDSDGFHEACRDFNIAEDGLFNSGAPGNDKILAEDNITCENALGTGEEEENAQGEIWLLTPPGLAVSAVAFLFLLFLAYFLLVPYGLRAYVAWALRQTVLVPLSLFRKLPPLRGLTCIGIFACIFLVAVSFGIFWRLSGGFKFRV